MSLQIIVQTCFYCRHMNTLENDRDLTKNFGNLNMDGDQELEEVRLAMLFTLCTFRI